jgi:hypothetical protein
MLEFLRTGKNKPDAHMLVTQISARYPKEKAWQIFYSCVIDDHELMRAVVRHAFDDLTSRPPPASQ